MRAVSSAKRIVDVEVAEPGELLRKSWIVFFFLLVKPDVLHQQHVAIRELMGGCFGFFAYRLGRKLHRRIKQLGQALSNRTE